MSKIEKMTDDLRKAHEKYKEAGREWQTALGKVNLLDRPMNETNSSYIHGICQEGWSI